MWSKKNDTMAEDLTLSFGNKNEKYESLLPQIQELIKGETEQVANMANIAAALKEQFAWWWVGFYVVKGDVLVLAPFQGTVACTRIAKGKGVCGTAWLQKQTIIVPNVDDFQGHIACSSLSKSEIVVPIFDENNQVKAVLDVDSEYLSHFDEVDKYYLEKLAKMISKSI